MTIMQHHYTTPWRWRHMDLWNDGILQH